MPRRDDSIDLDELPKLSASDDRLDMEVSDQPAESMVDSTVKSSFKSETPESSNFSSSSQNKSVTSAVPLQSLQKLQTQLKILWSLVLVLGIACAALAYLFSQSSGVQSKDQARIDALEARLSSTDESMSQSSVAMQVKLNDLKTKTDELWGQMDKLWASAWRRNQTEISEHGSQLKSQEKDLKEIRGLLAQVDKLNTQLAKEMKAVTRDGQANKKLVESMKKSQSDVNASVKVM